MRIKKKFHMAIRHGGARLGLGAISTFNSGEAIFLKMAEIIFYIGRGQLIGLVGMKLT